MIRKRGKRRRGRTEVRVVAKDRNKRKDHRAENKEGRQQKSVEARRPRIGTRCVGSEMEVGVFIVRSVHDTEV